MPLSPTLPLPRFAPNSGFSRLPAVLSALAALILIPFTAMSTPAAFPATEPGIVELKTLPAGLLVRSEAKGDYFEKNGDLFRALFRYIRRKDIAMTTPVEAHLGDTSAMYFWIATPERAKAEPDLSPTTLNEHPQPNGSTPPFSPSAKTTAADQSISQSKIDNNSVPDASTKTLPEGVVVLKRSERLVVSAGARGGYSRGHFEEARTKVLAWLAARPDLVTDGEAYAVYWNSPFVPGFLKRYEVHIPVKSAAPILP